MPAGPQAVSAGDTTVDPGLEGTPQASAFTKMFGGDPTANYTPAKSVGRGVAVAQPYTPTYTDYSSLIQPGPAAAPAFNPFDYSSAPTPERLAAIQQSLSPFMTAPAGVAPTIPNVASYTGYNPFSGDANPYSLTRAPMPPQEPPAAAPQPFGASPQGARMVGSGVAVAQQPDMTPQPFSRDTMLNRNPFLDQYFQTRNPFALTSARTMGGAFDVTPTPPPMPAPTSAAPPMPTPVAMPGATPAAQPSPATSAATDRLGHFRSLLDRGNLREAKNYLDVVARNQSIPGFTTDQLYDWAANYLNEDPNLRRLYPGMSLNAEMLRGMEAGALPQGVRYG